jgi:hypothetical protein
MTESILMNGLRLSGQLVTVYAVIANTDKDEGRGSRYVHSYYEKRGDAQIGADGVGTMGRPGKIEERQALRTMADGVVSYFLVYPIAMKLTAEQMEQRVAVRAQALAKLSAAEREALGIITDVP